MARYWLLKSEPGTFSIDDLMQAPHQTTCWEGVRNYQARNFLRTMAVGDRAFFYHSNADPPAIVGIVKVVKSAYPDHYAFDANNQYFDPKSQPNNPTWVMVDAQFVRKFSVPLPLERLRTIKGLGKMELLRKGSRLSVQPVTKDEWTLIVSLTQQSRKS